MTGRCHSRFCDRNTVHYTGHYGAQDLMLQQKVVTVAVMQQ